MLSSSSISRVLDVYRPERSTLLSRLAALSSADWTRPTECPLYTIKGVASHVLGDDLSLLSRQRDGAEPGTMQMERKLPGADFRTLLDTFNDQWVEASGFFSTQVLMELLGLTGEWTASYYERVDPEAPGEAVGLFGTSQGSSSPFWQAIAREYLERWMHHSQIRRALGEGALAERSFLKIGIELAAAIGRLEAGIPTDADGEWSLGAVVLGPAQQAANILTRGHTSEEVQRLARGPNEAVALLAAVTGRP